jgi:hypothetical protein
MKREEFKTEPATQAVDFCAQFKQFFHGRIAQAVTCPCAQVSRGSFIVAE